MPELERAEKSVLCGLTVNLEGRAFSCQRNLGHKGEHRVWEGKIRVGFSPGTPNWRVNVCEYDPETRELVPNRTPKTYRIQPNSREL